MGGILMPIMGETGQMGYVVPSTLPNLSLWYNASASTTVISGAAVNNFQSAVVNGGSISKWHDLQNVAGDSNVTGGTGKQPTYSIPVQNGLGAILYNSANSNNLDINPAAWSQNLSGMTIYVLARPTSLPGTVFPLTVSDTNLGIWWNGTNWSIGQGAGTGTVTVTNDTTKFHIYGMVFDGTQTGNANRLEFRYDRSGKTLSFTGTVGTTTASPAYWFFGGDARGSVVNATFASTFMSGYMGEVLIWTRALSTAELGAVELYLNQKWGLGL